MSDQLEQRIELLADLLEKSGHTPTEARRPAPEGRPMYLSGHEYGVKLNSVGRAKYIEVWAVNHQLHPDVDAPDPMQVQEAQP